MIERSRQVGWSEAEWNRLRQAVSEAAVRGRVVGSVLPIYGPLPRSTHVVPSEWLNPEEWTVDDVSTAPIVEIAIPLSLSATQVAEEDLSSALQLFARAASALARLEDWTIINGRPKLFRRRRRNPLSIGVGFQTEGGEERYLSEEDTVPELDELPFSATSRVETRARQDSWSQNAENRMRLRLLLHNPGALGLLAGSGVKVPYPDHRSALATSRQLDSHTLIESIIEAISELEGRGRPGPFTCVLSNEAFKVANTPLPGSLVLPRDRIEPFLGRELLRSSAIDDRQWEMGRPGYQPEKNVRDEPRPLVQGVVLSLAGDPIDLAVAVDPTLEFLSVDETGRYRFRVYERFALRIKQPDAIVRLEFSPPRGTPEDGGGGQESSEPTAGSPTSADDGSPPQSLDGG